MDKYVVLHIGNSISSRRYPITKFIDIAFFIKSRGYRVILVGGRYEVDLMKYLRSTPFEVKINILTLTQYCELVSSASAFLGGDTGPTHMAIALDIPTVCILGGGHFNRYFPYPKITQSQIKKIEYVYIQKECYNCEWLCTDKNLFSCIKDIDTNMIKNAFSLLGIC